jgi:hypothetical protein
MSESIKDHQDFKPILICVTLYLCDVQLFRDQLAATPPADQAELTRDQRYAPAPQRSHDDCRSPRVTTWHLSCDT